MSGISKARAFFAFLLVTSAVAAGAAIEKGPYLQNVTQTGITICWVSDAEQPGVVEYGTAEPLDKKAPSEAPTKRHEVKIADLSPGTTYLYRVVAGRDQSPVARFQTAPSKPEPFRFAVVGDTRSNHDVHRKIVEQMVAFEPALVFNTGDLVRNGHNAEDWDAFFDINRDLMRQVPYYPVLGNHEGNSPLYFEYFALPGNERYYSFDWGSCHFIALDSDSPYLTSQEQKDWLYQDLSSVKWQKFVFVFFHHPMYSGTASLGRRMGAREVREQFGPLLNEYGVDAVFMGHDHNYQHTQVDGVHYIITGGGGAGLYPVSPKWGFSEQASVHNWCQLFVDGDAVTVKALSIEGDVLDTFVISRQAGE